MIHELLLLLLLQPLSPSLFETINHPRWPLKRASGAALPSVVVVVYKQDGQMGGRGKNHGGTKGVLR